MWDLQIEAPLIPEDKQAEMSILGAVLLDNRLLPEAAVLPVKAFAIPSHRVIFEAMLKLGAEDAPIDPITLKGAIADNELVAPGQISALIDTMPRLDNLSRYVDMVHRKYIIREALRVASRAMLTLQDPEADVATVQQMITKLTVIADDGMVQDTVIEVSDIAPSWALDLEQKSIEGPKDALPTGYRKLDKAIGGGWYRGDLVLIGGRPGMGKSASMLTLALQQAQRGLRVHFVSLEMSRSSLMDRAVAQTIRVDSRLLRSGEVSPEELKLAFDAAMNIGALPLTINDTSDRTTEDILAEIRKLHRLKDGIDVLYLDYMGEVRLPSKEVRVETGHALKKLRATGKELGFAVVIGGQLNRGADNLKETQRPKLSDFRDTGEYEQICDLAIFPYRPSYAPGEIQQLVETDAEWLIAKQRNGPTGMVRMEYHPKYTLYREV